MKFRIAFIILFAAMSVNLFPQQDLEKKLSGEYSPLEIVTISQYASFTQAVKMLSAVSELVTGKGIVSLVEIESPIGVEVKKMPYKDALNLIVNVKNLTYEEREGSIVIKPKDDVEAVKLEEDTYADITAREVKISAVFFEADVENSREQGIDWNFLLSKNGINIGSSLRTKLQPSEEQQQNRGLEPEFNLRNSSEFTTGDWTGNFTGLFRFFESNNLGEIISSPNVTVRDKQQGRIQIGSDFSVKQKDFSGNTVERFYSAGAIIEVTPYVYNKNGIDYVLLKLAVERSSFFPSDLTTEIKKTAATSDVLLLDGEETVIGGLYVNEETIIRTGIPYLKDLPWWVFGIRYLTGSDQTIVRKKEIIILLKAELLDTLEERFVNKTDKNLIKEQMNKDEKRISNYKGTWSDKEINKP